MRALYVLLFAIPQIALAFNGNLSPYALAKAATVECAPGAACSPSTGLLSFTTPAEASQCTASLVAPDIVATNGHCVPEDIRQAGASCAGRVWMNFTKSADPNFETQMECDSVLFVEKQKNANVAETPDYAFYRLKNASRRPFLRISRAGFGDGEEISFERVNPVKKDDRIFGMQETLSCRAIQHSLLSNSFSHDRAPVVMIGDCLPMFGNSGSPLIGRDGTIRGVIHAKPGVTDTTLKTKKITLTGALAPHGFGTNYACRALPSEVSAPQFPAACAEVRPANESYARLQRLMPEDLGNFRGKWATQNFVFDFIKFGPFALSYQPACAVGGGTRAPSTMRFKLRIAADRYVRVKTAELESAASEERVIEVPACGEN